MTTPSPGLIHRWDHTFSILSIVTFPRKKLLFAGTQDSKILVFNLPTYNLVSTLTLGDVKETHTRSSVLCLERSSDEKYLFSGGADSLIRVWSIYDIDSLNSSIRVEEVATVYSLTDIGDIFSLRYLDTIDTLVFGCQNASLLFLDNIFDRILYARGCHKENINKLPHRRYDKFFDSSGPSGRTGSPAPPPLETSSNTIYNASKEAQVHRIIEVPSENIINYAHNGFIYSLCKLCLKCSTLLEDGKKHEHVHSHDYKRNSTAVSECIISGGGDGISKMWFFSRNAKGTVSISSIAAKLDNDDTVISQAVEFPFLYCGLSEGVVKIWDLSTKQHVSTLYTPQKYDVISISVYMDHIFAINESGTTMFYENEVIQWEPNQGKMLSSDIFVRHDAPSEKQISLLTGANDGSLTLWDLSEVMHLSDWAQTEEYVQELRKQLVDSSENKNNLNSEEMLETLRYLISFQSVSQNPDTSQQLASRRCASYLQKLFVKFGATKATLLPVKDGNNPVAFALFKGKNPNKKRIMWYGHYDVVPGNQNRWLTDPFALTCENGFMKGRGVSDNKGPLVAALYSVVTLAQRDQLLNDIVFLVEGSEEIGSPGLAQVCREHRDLIGNQIDWIFLSNSTWVDRENPCLNYGLRGVINAQITVWGEQPDRHSGIDGGLHKEPVTDLIKLISKLQDDDGKVLIPHFYEPLKDLSEIDYERLNKVVEFANLDKKVTLQDLITNWTKPSLSVTTMNISGPGNITVIPQSATIGISIRLVPEQEVGKIKHSLKEYLTKCFEEFSSGNHLEVSIVNEADAWLGDPTNHAYEVLKEALTIKWGKQPLFVREGGSIPCIRTLEKLLAAPAVQIPCGQSTDNAHLDNENLRIENWTYMTEILSQVFNKL